MTLFFIVGSSCGIVLHGDVAVVKVDMTKTIFSFFLASIALGGYCVTFAEAATECAFDRNALMALDENHFDQDVANGGGGWRDLASKPACRVIAADLIRDYRTTHTTSRPGLLFWHEGQLRATANDYASAIPLLEKARGPATDDQVAWNEYVDATVAFLRKDRVALEAARTRLADVKPQPGMTVKDGFVEIHTGDGRTAKMAWPMNLNVVDGLRHCFDKPYADAYSPECRAPVPKTEK